MLGRMQKNLEPLSICAAASTGNSICSLGIMSRRWIQNPSRCADEYLDGMRILLSLHIDTTRVQLESVVLVGVRNGMIETYSIWNLHGEQLDNASIFNATRVDNVEPIVDPNEQVMDIINDAFPFALTNINQEGKMTCLPQWTRMLPTDNCLPKDHRHEQKVLNDLGLGYEKIHACKNNCMLFYKEYETLDTCPICKELRFKMTSQNRTTKIPQKVMRYLSLKPRLQRLYMSTHTATDMRWHKENGWGGMERVRSNIPRVAADPRNVRLGLATDGFNPYGVLNQHHSTWPIFVFPYNLPHWKCMKKEYMMMTVLMTEDPGRSIDVYLRPLVDELKDLWTNGVRTYDKSTGKMFTLRAAVMWTVNDFLAYAMRWLPWDHEWREKDKEFDGTQSIASNLENGPLNRLDFLLRKTVTQTRPSTHLNWTHKPMFFELPYWSKLKLRHNLDVMHVEKNVFDTLMDTILDIEGKTKDTIKARLDLERMGIQRGLWMKRHCAMTLSKSMQVRDDIPSSFLHKYDPRDGSLAKRGIARWSCQLSLDVSNRKASRRAEKTVRRAKPEGSIIEAWVQYESLTFCGIARPFGYPVRGESFSRNDMEVAHWFVLNNCDEIMAYLDEHEEMMKREHPSHLYAKKHRDLFPQWFLEYVNKLKSSNSPSYSEELYNLAFGRFALNYSRVAMLTRQVFGDCTR
ncbi:hypothetical protein Prudu_771S000200 [Prunus dulcis]|uniref:Uncharacterized protein n=1 Tax=Prunus dulcis TaxID=3755 RepID=A0A5H2Y044_PRUDU|nr:hypothetical protein Prudu_771S000200 [Prunus dulcis]